mgnify:FL=1
MKTYRIGLSSAIDGSVMAVKVLLLGLSAVLSACAMAPSIDAESASRAYGHIQVRGDEGSKSLTSVEVVFDSQPEGISTSACVINDNGLIAMGDADYAVYNRSYGRMHRIGANAIHFSTVCSIMSAASDLVHGRSVAPFVGMKEQYWQLNGSYSLSRTYCENWSGFVGMQPEEMRPPCREKTERAGTFTNSWDGEWLKYGLGGKSVTVRFDQGKQNVPAVVDFRNADGESVRFERMNAPVAGKGLSGDTLTARSLSRAMSRGESL